MGDGAVLISPDGEPIESADRFRERVRRDVLRDERRDLVDWLRYRADSVIGPRLNNGDGLHEVLREVIVEIERGSHAR